MASNYFVKFLGSGIRLLICIVLLTHYALAQGFHVGVKGTACSLDPHAPNDPCGSLYEAICDGAHCKCPPGTVEDTILKRCSASSTKTSGGTATKKGGGGDDFFDLPFDYVPGDKPKDKPKPAEEETKPITFPDEPDRPQPPRPAQPLPPSQPAQPQPGYPAQPPQPGYPAQPRPPSEPQGPSQDSSIGEKAGGGIGGGIGLVLLVGLTYYCCKGGKGKELMNKLPFFKGSQTEPSSGGANYDMEQQVIQQQSSAHPNSPPPAAV